MNRAATKQPRFYSTGSQPLTSVQERGSHKIGKSRRCHAAHSEEDDVYTPGLAQLALSTASRLEQHVHRTERPANVIRVATNG